MIQKRAILHNLKFEFTFIVAIVLSACQSSTSSLELPSLFSDNMVLQRNAEVQVWGNSSSQTKIIITVPWGQFDTTSEQDGSWNLIVPTADYDKAFAMEVCDELSCISIQNVVLGEVWLASGQSNMSMPLKGWLPTDPIENSTEEITNAAQHQLRFFKTAQTVSHIPKRTVEGSWKVSDSINAPEFSATAYFFAKNLHKELQVPIGIINSSWGGTPVQSWADQSALQSISAYTDALESIADMDEKLDEFKKWLGPLDNFPNTAEKYNFDEWSKLAYDDQRFSAEKWDDSQWQDLSIPGNYADVFSEVKVNDFDGIVWIRKSFTIKKLGEDYKFRLGLVDDMDFTYINGEFVGATIGSDSFKEKKYDIPSGLLKEGENTIAIRLIDTMGDARIYSPLSIVSSEGEMSLEGNWKALPIAELFENNFYKLNHEGTSSNPRPNFVKISAWTPTSLFNGMINPLIPYTIKGAIWYQGESNVGFEDEYKLIFKNMIEGWRSKWNYEFPFYFVQIAPYKYNNGKSAALRDAQRQVTSLSNTGMAVTLDIGNPDNIHPAKKNEVGKRLSNLALEKTYGYQNKLDASFPISVARKNNIVTISFDCVEGGELQLKSTYSDQIEISADNIDFYKAKAVVEDCFLHLYSNRVKQPKFIRHAWRDTGTGAILNSQGIPVSTFLVAVED